MARKIAGPFSAEQFTPTEWSTAQDKANFANHYVKFVRSGFPWALFHDWFYTRLRCCFGHIAHYDRAGFYAAWFETPAEQVRFIEHALEHPCYGRPEFTYSDAEALLQKWLRAERTLENSQRLHHINVEKQERELLAKLQAKYPSQSEGQPTPVLDPTLGQYSML